MFEFVFVVFHCCRLIIECNGNRIGNENGDKKRYYVDAIYSTKQTGDIPTGMASVDTEEYHK